MLLQLQQKSLLARITFVMPHLQRIVYTRVVDWLHATKVAAHTPYTYVHATPHSKHTLEIKVIYVYFSKFHIPICNMIFSRCFRSATLCRTLPIFALLFPSLHQLLRIKLDFPDLPLLLSTPTDTVTLLATYLSHKHISKHL